MLDWTDKQDGVSDVLATDVNSLAAAIIDNEHQIDDIIEIKENILNKVTSLSSSSTDTQYPSAKAVYDELAGYVEKEVGKGLSTNDFSNVKKDTYDTATLIAMYNEVDIVLSPENYFVAYPGGDENSFMTISGVQDTELVIPFMINGKIVKKIYFDADLPEVITLRIPNCVEEIINFTPGNMPKLQSVNIPTSCTVLGTGLFAGCTDLEEVITPIKPNWELSILASCFNSCSSLNNIDSIIDGIKEISPISFIDCTGIKNVIIPESVNNISQCSFYGTNINCFTVLNAQCNISSYAFANSDEQIEEIEFTYPDIIKGYKNSTAETYASTHNISFIALDENVESTSNKVTSISSSSTDTQYPSAKAVYDELALKADNLALTDYYNKSAVDAMASAKENTGNKVTSLSSASTDTQYPSAKCVYDELALKADQTDIPTKTSDLTNDSGFITSSGISGKENTSNKVTSLSSSSTDTEYPSAKCVYDIVGDIETALSTLNSAFNSLLGGSV